MRTMMNVLVSKTPLEGALNSLYCATSPSAPEKGQGGYFTPVGKLDSKADAFDSEENGKLWRHSEAVLERL